VSEGRQGVGEGDSDWREIGTMGRGETEKGGMKKKKNRDE
jgi:hypothetical protein